MALDPPPTLNTTRFLAKYRFDADHLSPIFTLNEKRKNVYATLLSMRREGVSATLHSVRRERVYQPLYI